MEVLQPKYLSVSYYQPIIQSIESHFGKYEYTPRVIIQPGLYKTYGALGETEFVRTADGTPVLIRIDADVWHSRPQQGLETLIHELLEWRAVERGEEYPHFFAEQNTPLILSEVTQKIRSQATFGQPITLFDLILARFPLLRQIVKGT